MNMKSISIMNRPDRHAFCREKRGVCKSLSRTGTPPPPLLKVTEGHPDSSSSALARLIIRYIHIYISLGIGGTKTSVLFEWRGKVPVMVSI